MSEEQVIELLEYIDISYPYFLRNDKIDETVKTWLEILHQYDYQEIKQNLEIYMKREENQKRPPTAYGLTNGLVKIKEKVNWDKMVYFCDNCHRPFNDYNKMMEHRARENSIEYIINQSVKWFNRTLSMQEIKSLWDMDQDKFNSNYQKLLQHIYRNTKNEDEKRIIGYIFNPPNIKDAMNFLNKRGEIV